MTFKISRNVSAPTHVQFGQHLTDVPVGEGLEVDDLRDELLEYVDVLLGRVAPPVESPYLTLMEVATVYHARALEMEMRIHSLEQDHVVVRGSPLNKFRTGQLRSFLEMSKKMADLGSRRLTQERILSDQRYDEGEAY